MIGTAFLWACGEHINLPVAWLDTVCPDAWGGERLVKRSFFVGLFSSENSLFFL